MPFNFSIEGDWDETAKPYDKKISKPLKLDDSGPAPDAADLREAHSEATRASDDVRIKQLEAVTQQVLAKLRAIEERLGLEKES